MPVLILLGLAIVGAAGVAIYEKKKKPAIAPTPKPVKGSLPTGASQALTSVESLFGAGSAGGATNPANVAAAAGGAGAAISSLFGGSSGSATSTSHAIDGSNPVTYDQLDPLAQPTIATGIASSNPDANAMASSPDQWGADGTNVAAQDTTSGVLAAQGTPTDTVTNTADTVADTGA